MQNENRNFKEQDLRGRSFKGQDLTGADFSDCDLRGVDFSFANLTDAKFCNAKTKESFNGLFFKWILTSLFSGIILGFCNFWTFKVFKFNLDILHLYNELLFMKVASLYSIILFLLAYIITKYKELRVILFFFFVVLAIPFWIVADFKITGASFGNQALLVATTIAIITTVIAASIMIKSTILDFAFILVVSVIIAGSFTAEQSELESGISGALAVTGSKFLSVNYFMLGVFIAKSCMEEELSQLANLRRFVMQLLGKAGTSFENSNLTDANFSGSDLKFANFKNAIFIRTLFYQVQNLHLAYTLNTPLEPRVVRNLLVTRTETSDKNFATLDLRGLDFSNLNLQDFDFSHANLSGANLSHTQMTGAILEGWAIDTETRLDDIECHYYYYLENGEKKRMPPEGEEYKAGEFTRIFQKIAKTIDIIAVNEIELAAIKLAVNKVKIDSDNDDIRVQAIEEKDGFIVVKVNVPKTEDIGQLYYKLQQEFKTIQTLLSGGSNQIKELGKTIDELKMGVNKERENLEKEVTTTIVNITDSIIYNDDGIINIGKVGGDITQQKS
ncbi:MAG: pentapeptide repeat-containing protein [Methylococcales bacterium]|nr:pentapeptide repeat-containing protein [Methylococcales bacterium]